MNYDHAFHAGNHADLLKHAILAAVVARLAKKPKPMSLIDAFAASGRYDLALDDRALRSGEWTRAAAPLWRTYADPAGPRETPPPGLSPFLDAWRMVNPDPALRFYPGSPELLRRLARADDKILCVERHPAAAEALRRALRGDDRARVYETDGWAALESFLPPTPRRGLVLIDPPFEAKNEAARLVAAAERSVARWSTGVFLIWLPIKTPQDDRIDAEIAARAPDIPLLAATLEVPDAPTALKRSALILLNPPYEIETDIRDIGDALSRVLDGRFSTRWRTPRR